MRYTREQIEAIADCPIALHGELRAAVRQLLAENDALQAEMQEQCRIIGMSAEREMSLRAERDALREDAERWEMSVIISKETLQPPSVRKHQTEINAYINAITRGFDLTYAIDAARKKGVSEGW